jgi:hypothetical protein
MMMVRRKGELSRAAIDRGWPYQVSLPASQVKRPHYEIIQAFCAGLSLCSRGHTFVRGDEWHNAFCFADKADALKFMARFEGEWFDPMARRRGHAWHLLKGNG